MAGILGGILGGDNGNDDTQQSNKSDTSVLDNVTNVLDVNASNSSFEQDEDGAIESNESNLDVGNGTSLDGLLDNMTNDQSATS